jgi:sugar transferase (PEP-CTERM/EpsH1 system associated)
MNILFLSLRCPYPPNRGDRIRNYYFIKHLAKKHRVTLVSFVESTDEIEMARPLNQLCHQVEFVLFNRTEALFNSASGFFSIEPFQVHYWRSLKMQKKVDELLDRNQFDLIHAHLFRMGQYVSKYNGKSKVLDLCDSLALNLSRRYQMDRGPHVPMLKWEADRVKKYEVEMMRSFDYGMVVAQSDRNYLISEDSNLKLAVIPVGIDLDYFLQSEPVEDESVPHLLFTGTMSYFPNIDAACYFCHQILPLIQEKIPSVHFSIVGSNPKKIVQKLASPSVTVTGTVPDTRPYFNQSSVFVSPMRSGSGLQVKHLEAMATGLPIVTTPLGASGLEGTWGEHLCVAETPKDFANRTIQLIQNSHMRRKIGKSGQNLVRHKYNWHVLGQQLENVYQQTYSAYIG